MSRLIEQLKWLWALHVMQRYLLRSAFSQRRYFWEAVQPIRSGMRILWPDAILLVTLETVREAIQRADREFDEEVRALPR